MRFIFELPQASTEYDDPDAAVVVPEDYSSGSYDYSSFGSPSMSDYSSELPVRKGGVRCMKIVAFDTE